MNAPPPDPPATEKPLSLMIVTGEVSGDMHAAAVLREARRLRPGLKAFGIGGDALRAAGMDVAVDVSEMSVMGITEVLRRLGFFRRVMRQMTDLAVRSRPDAVLLVDYPGFNLRFAARAHAAGLRVVYYICPQVWAWQRSRIPRMAQIVDKLIAIFPFEPDHFRGTGLDAEFVGHPLVDEAEAALQRPRQELPWRGAPRLALLPGSRPHEIRRLLPVMLETAAHLRRAFPDLGILVAAPSDREAALAAQIEKDAPCEHGPVVCVAGKTREILRQADAALVKSGTSTVEAALMQCPMSIAYRVSPLTYLLGKMLVRVPHIGMANIVAGRRVCPEFVQSDVRAEHMAAALRPLLEDTPQRQSMCHGLAGIRAALGERGASARAAQALLRAMTAPA